MKEKLKDYFARYQNANVAYVSGDTIFLSESAAMSYGRGPVHKVVRSEVEKEGKEDNSSEPLDPISKEQLDAMGYNEMKAAVKARALVVENEKKETLYAALLALIK